MVSLLFLMASVASCGDTEKKRREESAAVVLGRAQALELSAEFHLDTVEIETLLNDVRSREAELRRRGHSRVADTYLATFLSTLDSVNPSLASELR